MDQRRRRRLDEKSLENDELRMPMWLIIFIGVVIVIMVISLGEMTEPSPSVQPSPSAQQFPTAFIVTKEQ